MKSVSTRLLSVILAINIIGMGFIAVISITLAANSLNEQTLARVGETTARDAGSIDAWVIRQTGYIEAVAADFSSMADIKAETIFPALVRHTELNEDYYSVYAGYPDGVGIFNDEWEPDYSEWIAYERDWYKGAAASPNETCITDIYKDAETGNFCLTFSKVFTSGGTTAGVVAADVFTTVLSDVVGSIDVGRDSYAFLTSSGGDIIIHPNAEYLPVVDDNDDTIFRNIALVDDARFSELTKNIAITGESVKLRSSDGAMRYYTARTVPSTGWILYTAIPVSVVDAPVYRQITATAGIFVAVLIIAAGLTLFSLNKLILHPVKDVTRAANLLAKGETGVRLDDNYIGEIALLAESFRGMDAFNSQQAEWLKRIADGDLSVEITLRGETDRIGRAVSDMLSRLDEMFVGITGSTRQVASGVKQIAGGAQSLAQGSTEQASAVEELSSSINDINQKTKQNSVIADEAAKLSESIKSNAEKGSLQMDKMMNAVREINDAGKSIENVIKTIDDIAFQTNILALNAAVEAARAGQHGKGFAVVAEEVRNLAAKSAAAAKNTGGYIENSIDKANLGLSIATETSDSLREIVEGINRSVEIVLQIAKSSGEQTEAIAQITSGIDQVAQVIHQNSATAEESAAASREISEQSETLEALISRFKLPESDALPLIDRDSRMQRLDSGL
ncbi:MAG: methyl-accepting chemotaxis protein [Oscillospiraceae bacterium]|nr:methyl-accepting chemotaxis protein [Oscillospiraceae bacterium]